MLTFVIPAAPSANNLRDQAIIAAYREIGSVWTVGERFGIAGQTVSKILRRHGEPTNRRYLGAVEKARIAEYYHSAPDQGFDLAPLAKELGRTRQFISRYAGKAGLTQKGRVQAPETLERAGRKTAETFKREGHPRGALGMTHSPETLAKLSQASRLNWATWKTFGTGPMTPEHVERRTRQMVIVRASISPEKIYSRARAGKRPDIGEQYFRSSWEANYARYLNLLKRLGAIDGWDYEPVTFWFSGVKRGTVSYKPDFRIFHKGDPVPEYIEIKGYATEKDATKWRRMRKYHPEIKLTIVAQKQYHALAKKWSSAIPQWEGDRGGGGHASPLLARASK